GPRQRAAGQAAPDVVPTVGDLHHLEAGAEVERMLPYVHAAQVLVERPRLEVVSEDPDQHGVESPLDQRPGDRVRELPPEPAAVPLPQHVDRVELAQIADVTLPLGPAGRETDHAPTALRDEGHAPAGLVAQSLRPSA